MLRSWLFSVVDLDNNECYLDEKGNAINSSDAKQFIGSDFEAKEEANRRANLWENSNDGGFVATIIFHSLGAIKGKGILFLWDRRMICLRMQSTRNGFV